MARKPPPKSAFVNLHGKPLNLEDLAESIHSATAKKPTPALRLPTPDLAAADVEQVCDGLALAGGPQSKTWLLQFLRHLERRTARNTYFSAADVQAGLQQLVALNRVQAQAGGVYDVPAQARVEPQARQLRSDPPGLAWRAFARASATYVRPDAEPARPDLRHESSRVAYARLVLYGGDLDLKALRRLQAPSWSGDVSARDVGLALVSPFLPDRFESMPAEVRNALLTQCVEAFAPDHALWQLLFPTLDAWIERAVGDVDARLRLVAADRCLHLGRLEACQRVLDSLPDDPHRPILQAAMLAWQGQWQDACTLFESTLKALAKQAKARRGLAPYRTLQWYLWSLLALHDTKAWSMALKLASAESGTRSPSPRGWGLFVHAVQVRLGDAQLLSHAFDAPRIIQHQGQPDEDANAVILAAWLGHVPQGWTAARLKGVVQGLVDADRPWKAELLRQACQRLGLPMPARSDGESFWNVRYFGAAPEAWRDALAAIQALGNSKSKPGTQAAPTLIWRLRLDRLGRVRSIVPFETPVGVRGPGKPREAKLAALKRQTALDPRDAAVVRCIVSGRYGNDLLLDRVAAALALVGHPRLELAHAPGQAVELAEALPVLELQRQKAADGSECFVFHLADAVLGQAGPGDEDEDDDFDDDDVDGFDEYAMADMMSSDAARGRLDSLRIVPDTVDRARLLRITPAQRRVAQLVAQRWAVPASAQGELESALKILAGHFQVHSDAAAGQELPCDSRLRAQLSPSGDGLQLRLVVRPFGDFGPEVLPGRGRERVLTLHQGLNLATRRDLAAEAAHLDAVRQALPMLDEAGLADASWLLGDPEDALAAVEKLPQADGVAALEWPRGKPLRVLPVASASLRLKVGSGQDWFSLQGELQLDEQRVLGLQRLLELVAESRRGRFVALGDGEYLALTDQLRRQLSDLQALGQADAQSLRLPAAGAGWLAQALEGAQVQADPAWTQRLQRLDEAAALQPQPPPALQAELRAYQFEGYAWMSRLAHAGLGACLADDMGLGKTVQTLALLLQRAAQGPALVLAPTSVCANWVAEAARFAPSLTVTLYGPGDRDQALQAAAAGHLVVASYALANLDIERLAARHWATLVLDEAQALKNAATQRAKSVASLEADFRLALSGTPVENRLADLWSLMNLLNPGLLGSSSRFGERFAIPIERDRDEAARQRLRRLVSPFLLRRTKAQVLSDLPPRTEIVHRVEPTPEERAFLEAARRQALEQVAQAAERATTPAQAAFQVLAELTRLRRAACDPRLVAPELGLVGAKVQEFERLATELVAGRHKALVFSQFTDFLKLLAERLRAAGIAHQYLDGSTPAATRASRVAAFQRGEGDLFLISLKAGGFGLNLTAADYVLIVDPWWNPAAEDQAMGRAHRIGQQRPVTVYRLVTAGSIEERIIDLHRDKRSLADSILADQDDARPVDAQALRALLQDVGNDPA